MYSNIYCIYILGNSYIKVGRKELITVIDSIIENSLLLRIYNVILKPLIDLRSIKIDQIESFGLRH